MVIAELVLYAVCSVLTLSIDMRLRMHLIHMNMHIQCWCNTAESDLCFIELNVGKPTMLSKIASSLELLQYCRSTGMLHALRSHKAALEWYKTGQLVQSCGEYLSQVCQ